MAEHSRLPPKGETPSLRIYSPGGEISDFPLSKPKVTIGRSKENDIVLTDLLVSRRHAEIQKVKNNWVIKDLGSFNRVRLNEKPIQSALLKPKDQIKVGLYKLIFLIDPTEASSPYEGLIAERDDDLEKWKFQTLRVSPQDCSRLALTTILARAQERRGDGRPDFTAAARTVPLKEDEKSVLASLERMNKVLFVLYEISRQLAEIQDHKELFKKIMDLIFMVIDADYGFLILVDKKTGQQFTPIVVKFKDEKLKQKGQVRASHTLIKKVIEDRVALLTSNALDDSRFNATESLIQQKIRSAICVPLWKKEEIIGVIQLNSDRPHNQFSEDDLELLKSIGCQMSMVLEQVSLNEKIKEEERLRNWLSRFHSPQIIDIVLKAREESRETFLEAKEVEATILFADIIGFTRLSEDMVPWEVNQFLNEYFSLITDVIFEYDGTLDKYIGDGIMAVFGAPLVKTDDTERAVHCALKMREKLSSLMENLSAKRRFGIRIGINTGRVVAGNIGSPRRLDYTVIGDAVNIASRLESIAESNQILIGEETYKQVAGRFHIKEVGPRLLKGKSSKIMVYEVLGGIESPSQNKAE